MNHVKLYKSGFVQRWHQNPNMAHFGQTDAAHQWGVAALLLMLNPDASKQLIIACLTHDVGELDAGDLSGPFKQEYPELANQHAAIERKHRKAILGSIEKLALNEKEHLWLDLCDRLEAALFVAQKSPHTLAKQGWPESLKKIGKMATVLECGEQVQALLKAVLDD